MDRSSAAPAVPPIPISARQHSIPSHRRDPRTPVSTDRTRDFRDRHDAAAPTAGPEVISSLITSFAVFAKPGDLEQPVPPPSTSQRTSTSPQPRSPRGGSFGVDYGAFTQSSLEQLREEVVSLDDLAASPPTIRTAKPPSGFSPLTAPPKSPREEGFKSFLSRAGRSGSASRPSSKGSLGSRDADTQSIGNLSIERGPAPSSPPTLKKQRSFDSWGRKTGRSHKGLMYMSSKERLREKEFEKKRVGVGVGGAATGAAGGPTTASSGASYMSGGVASRSGQPLAETAINEEASIPSLSGEEAGTGPERASWNESAGTSVSGPRSIPARDSSLRKASSAQKRSSKRSSKRDSDIVASSIIPELEESSSSSKGKQPKRASDSQAKLSLDHTPSQAKRSADLVRSNVRDSSTERASTMPNTKRPRDLPNTYVAHSHIHDADEDGAPSPAVAQGRKRDEYIHRRRSSRSNAVVLDNTMRPKRSSSRLKQRLSGAQSPLFNETASHHESNSASDHPHVGYERPQSADSIDDAVESYLCSPRLSQKIRHPQSGRVISFSEVGDPNGFAVFCCVGMGLTRYITAFYDELALTLKLRLITPDRPGVGDSEAYGDGTATPLGWPDDVYAICQSLKITKFSILAHSAGAIYALATALRMPQHIRGRIHLLAPWIPPSQMSVFGASSQTPLPPTNAIPTSQRILRALPTPILKAANSGFMSATSSSLTSSLPKQKRSRKDRKSGAGGGVGGGKGIDNKENHGEEVKQSTISDMPSAPARDLVATEYMDRIRPDSTLSANHSDAHDAAAANANAHGRHGSNSSARRAGGQGRDKAGSAQGHRANTASQRAIHPSEILSAASALESDRERQAVYDNRLTHAIWELATTGANPAVDLLVCLERRHTIGFRYVDITRPTVIHHGSKDTRVPVETVRWLGKTMKRCEVRVLEGEGHGLMASAVVMGKVLMEISREWEEWGRVTGQTRRDSRR